MKTEREECLGGGMEDIEGDDVALKILEDSDELSRNYCMH